jgi:hypothetical protein
MVEKSKTKGGTQTLLQELIELQKKHDRKHAEELRTEKSILNSLKKLTRMFELGVKFSSGILPLNEIENTLNRIEGKYRQAEAEAEAKAQHAEESGEVE